MGVLVQFLCYFCINLKFIDTYCDLSNSFILTLQMAKSGIPGLNENAAKYVQKAMMPELDDSEATAEFTK